MQWAREWETSPRQTLYQWRHLPADMIVSDFIECPLAIHSTDFGIVEDVDVAKTDDANHIVSRHFKIQIRDWPDLEKIQMPRITPDSTGAATRPGRRPSHAARRRCLAGPPGLASPECHRANENQPPMGGSKPATLRRGLS